eukprot:COSAG02_NODE_4427_length_5372_cov_4.047791_4_plen_74_part_00
MPTAIVGIALANGHLHLGTCRHDAFHRIRSGSGQYKWLSFVSELYDDRLCILVHLLSESTLPFSRRSELIRRG